MQRLAREYTPEATRYLIRTTRIWGVATGRDIAVLRGYEGFVKLEPEAWCRGHDYDEPVVSKGRIVSDKDGNPLLVKKYSDTLLVTLLKAHYPEKYKEDRISTEIGNKDGKPFQIDDARQRDRQTRPDCCAERGERVNARVAAISSSVEVAPPKQKHCIHACPPGTSRSGHQRKAALPQ
jgi:hypothetical protein